MEIEIIARTLEEKRALAVELLKRKQKRLQEIAFFKKNSRPPLIKQERPESIPLSFAQQRLWFLDQFVANRAAYNILIAVRLKGEINVEAFERAISSVIRRHEVLRTVFKDIEGRAEQVILDPFCHLTYEDFKHLAPEAQKASLQALAETETQKVFNLNEGPLVRFHLMHCQEKEYCLFITLHHSIFDGWSTGILGERSCSLL